MQRQGQQVEAALAPDCGRQQGPAGTRGGEAPSDVLVEALVAVQDAAEA